MSYRHNRRKIHVTNLSHRARVVDISNLFDPAGHISSIQTKGNSAFIDFADETAAERAIRQYDNSIFMGQRITVQGYSYGGSDFSSRSKVYSLYVTGLDDRTSRQDLWQFGERAGRSVSYVDVYSRHGNTEGLVEYNDWRDFDYALKRLDYTRVNGYRIRVFDKQPKYGDRGKKRDREGGRNRDRNHNRRRDSDRERGKDRGKDRERDRERDRRKDRERDTERDRDRERDRRRGYDEEYGHNNNTNNGKMINYNDSVINNYDCTIVNKQYNNIKNVVKKQFYDARANALEKPSILNEIKELLSDKTSYCNFQLFWILMTLIDKVFGESGKRYELLNATRRGKGGFCDYMYEAHEKKIYGLRQWSRVRNVLKAITMDDFKGAAKAFGGLTRRKRLGQKYFLLEFLLKNVSQWDNMDFLEAAIAYEIEIPGIYAIEEMKVNGSNLDTINLSFLLDNYAEEEEDLNPNEQPIAWIFLSKIAKMKGVCLSDIFD